ncbi:MAG: hypothetical protein IIA87_05895 [Nanoarchaeota archaeon]|nr:hypothetical protein [Nanoarchaeota archaeon]
MAKVKNTGLHQLLNIAIWITGILVSLAVGFGMISGTLPIWFIPDVITAIAGWIVIVLTLLGVIIAIVEKTGG